MASPNPTSPLEPFPPAPDSVPPNATSTPTSPTRPPVGSNASRSSQTVPRRPRGSSAAASIASTASSGIRSILDADLPPGFLAATGAAASKAPSLSDIRRGSYGNNGWNKNVPKRDRTKSSDGASSPLSGTEQGQFPTLREEDHGTAASGVPLLSDSHTLRGSHENEGETMRTQNIDSAPSYDGAENPDAEKSTARTEVVDPVTQQTPWVQPPPLPWTTSFMIGLRTYLKWVITIPGFLITLYGLNIVAWGGMLFLLLCNAAPAMCKPSCNDIDSPRRIWIEIDSQILNALFCVTGFGLAPWRFRDLYWWGYWRLGRKDETKSIGIRRLAGVHRNWFRLPGSDSVVGEVDPKSAAVPIPATKAPTVPLTGVRAPPTSAWKMDWVILMNVSNTFLQTVLSGFMWGLNRYDRPSWSTGLFVALACIVAGLGGWMIYQEGKKVKKVEGAPLGKEERKARGWPAEDVETGAPEISGSRSDADHSVITEDKKSRKRGFMKARRAAD